MHIYSYINRHLITYISEVFIYKLSYNIYRGKGIGWTTQRVARCLILQLVLHPNKPILASQGQSRSLAQRFDNGEIMGIRRIKNMLFGKRRVEIYSTPDDKRPVKLVPDGPDSWRVVYDD